MKHLGGSSVVAVGLAEMKIYQKVNDGFDVGRRRRQEKKNDDHEEEDGEREIGCLGVASYVRRAGFQRTP